MQNALLSPCNLHGKVGRPFRPLQQDTCTSVFRKARPCALLHKRYDNPRLSQRNIITAKADDGQEQQPQDSSDKEVRIRVLLFCGFVLHTRQAAKPMPWHRHPFRTMNISTIFRVHLADHAPGHELEDSSTHASMGALKHS